MPLQHLPWISKVDDPKHHRATPTLIWYVFLLKYMYGKSGFRMIDYCKEAQEIKYVKQMHPPPPQQIKQNNRGRSGKRPMPFKCFQ